MSKLGMGLLAVLTAGGILSSLNMRRVTKQRERTMTRAMRRTEPVDPWLAPFLHTF